MKFLKSIRWRLQLWYGILLVVVLAGFGITVYQLESSRRMRRIDEELQRRLPILVNSQRPTPGNRERREFRISPKDAPLFDREDGGGIYYVVWLRHGTPVTRSATAPADVPQPKAGDPPNRLRGNLRETFLFPGPGDCVLAGKSIAGELDDLRQLAWWLAAAGGTVLLICLAVGAWFVTRAMRPIHAISAAAESIATGDLTRRIDTTESESELGQLAGVLNSTFSRLDDAFNRQARFTADAAHELRTPLAVMLTHIQNSLSCDDLPADHRVALEACERAARRMRHLTDSLLTLARIDSGKDTTHESCDLAVITGDAINLLRSLARQHGVSIETDLQPAPCTGNANGLSQVVQNLVGNAIFHNRSGGVVRISCASSHDMVVLRVSDNGPGIAEKDLPFIFDRFYRADTSRSAMKGGTGLGLSIARSIVEAHRGTITVESELEKGSTFTIRLPVNAVTKSLA